MKVLSIDIHGKFAHFRKYYANNTALSYFIPPRTTIMGMLAAILKKPKDSYYEGMASDKLLLTVQVLSPMKKKFHRVNFLSIKGPSGFRGAKGRIQTPFEVITPINLQKGELGYRIFISCTETGEKIYDLLERSLSEGIRGYTLSLGTANFLARIGRIQKWEGVMRESENKEVILDSVINSDTVKGIVLQNQDTHTLKIEEELMPGDFVNDYNREVSKMNKVLVSTSGQSLVVRLHGKYCSLKDDESTTNIQFLE